MSQQAGQSPVLVLAPTGRDGPALADVLLRAGIATRLCTDIAILVAALDDGADAVILAEEAMLGADTALLVAWVQQQPPWSDMPFVTLTSQRHRPAETLRRSGYVTILRNVSLIERPIQAITMVSAVQTALRARQRQYEVRDHLSRQHRAAEELERLVAARTVQLEQANDALKAQIAERAKVEEALRHAQKLEAVGQLTGGIAHDFNNLLMVISGGLDMLERQSDPARRQRLLTGMRQAAGRGATLTRQLLAFSRKQALRPQAVDLRGHVAGMRELLDRSLRGDVQVSLQLAPDLWPIAVDPGELELAILNLAVNARDAMPSGGTITVRAGNLAGLADGKLRGDFVSLSVIDTGTGMPPEVLARVFEPFFTTKDIGNGSGLGLAQVYGFTQQSGGETRIETAVGHGTTITLLLPRASKLHAAEQVAAEPAASQVAAVPPGNVLLVEDDDEVAALVTEMLSQLGLHSTRAASATAALGALANGRAIDLVFSDVMMPGGMNGVDLAREVKRRRPGLPILLTTAYAEASRRAAEAEGVAILAKPYRLEDLAQATRRALGR